MKSLFIDPRFPPMPESNDPEANRVANEGRTYDWLHPDNAISGPQYSDEEVAGIVRMLMRDDLHHEAICCLARDRIMALVKEKAELRTLWSKACDEGEALQAVASAARAFVSADTAVRALSTNIGLAHAWAVRTQKLAALTHALDLLDQGEGQP